MKYGCKKYKGRVIGRLPACCERGNKAESFLRCPKQISLPGQKWEVFCWERSLETLAGVSSHWLSSGISPQCPINLIVR